MGQHLRELVNLDPLPYCELINCVLCTCDCSVLVVADQCIDYDGVIDALNDFREGVSRGQGVV